MFTFEKLSHINPQYFQAMTLCNSNDHMSSNDNDEKCDTNSSINDTVLESPTWIGFAVFKTILMIIGLLGNVLTFAALAINPQGFKLVSRIMLQLQAIADSFVCIMGIGLYTQKHLWMTNNHSFNLFLCHVWHSQHAFWVGVLASVMNIVIMTTERFILIVYPMKHLRMSPKKCLYPTFVIIQVLSIVSLCPTFYMVQYHEQNATCSLDPFPKFEPYLPYYSVWWFLIGYLLPVAYCIGLYAKIILTLKKRQEEMGGDNQILKIADKQLTKTAMAVAGVFIVTMSWDAWFFIQCFLDTSSKGW